MQCVEYTSHEHKRAAYVGRTLPLIFAAAIDAGRYLPFLPASPHELHELVRGGRYVEEVGPIDCVQAVLQTIRDGGDCEDWAAVQLWHLNSHGHRARLVTAGDELDNFRHVYVEVFDGGRWTPSDPKGSQKGNDYGVPSAWPVKRRWMIGPDSLGKVVEIDATPVAYGSGCNAGCGNAGASATVVAGSGSTGTNPLALLNLTGVDLRTLERHRLLGVSIPELPAGADQSSVNTWADFYRLLDDATVALFFKAFDQYGFDRGNMPKLLPELRRKLDAGTLGVTRGRLLHFTREAARRDAAQFRWLLGSNAAVARDLAKLDPTKQADNERELGSLNLALVSRWAASLIEPGDHFEARRKTLRDFAISLGGLPSASDENLAALAAAMAAEQFTALGLPFDQAVAAVDTDSNAQAVIDGLVGTAFVAGSGSSLTKFFRHPLKVLQRVFVTEPGKGIRQLAQNILNADKSAPWLSQFMLRPLGVMIHAEALKQLGNAMVEGKITVFDERQLAWEAGSSFQSAGQVLVVASPVIPQPYGVMAAAVGAAFIAGGRLIHMHIQDAEVQRHGGVVATICYDDLGRQVECDTLLPLDPYARQLELQRRAEVEAAAQAAATVVDPNNQHVGEWRKGADALWYGWHNFGPHGTYWTAVQTDAAGNAVAAWVYIHTQEGPRWQALS